MGRKTLILLAAAAVFLIAGIGAAVFFLYRDTSPSGAVLPELASDSRCGLFAAVPADAAAVLHFNELQTLARTVASDEVASGFLRNGAFGDFLSGIDARSREFGSVRGARAILSWHYDGKLVPLLIVDVSRAGSALPDGLYALRAYADSCRLANSVLDCSKLAEKGTWLEKRNILLVSVSDLMLKSSERHISQGISVLDQGGFAEAVSSVSGGKGQLYVSNDGMPKLFTAMLNSGYLKYSDFFRRLCDWCAFSFDGVSSDGIFISGTAVCGEGNEKYMNALSGVSPAPVTVSGILPSYTVAAFSMPVADAEASAAAYGKFADTKMGQAKYDAMVGRLAGREGISPAKWAEQTDIREVATGSFYTGGSLETVLLIKTGKPDAGVLFKGTDIQTLKGYVPEVHDFAYSGFASSLFGQLFSVKDESKFTFIDGWVIAGSAAAVEEYVSGRALESRLSDYMSGSGVSSRLDIKNSKFSAFVSLSEDSKFIDMLFRPAFAGLFRDAFSKSAFAPAVFSVSPVKGTDNFTLTIERTDDIKAAAPVTGRDAEVIVPKGPFEVMNSGTGKMNSFSQQDNLYLTLKDENGKGLWSAEMKTPICGRAGTVDYFNNGKLQILFASGSKLYLIDRLGRFVRPFPVELGKEVLLGPDIYDFNGTKRYNVLVLHKDNTIEMYNLAGNKPDAWKGISCGEPVMSLPEMIKSGGKTFWVVRTSLQTLIYPFYGGEPLTVFEGNRRIRPDSPLAPVKNGVEAVRHDGKKTIVELK